MNLNINDKIILNKKNKKTLNFYIKDRCVYCKAMDDISNKEIKLIDNVVNYDVALDMNDNIHCIGSTLDGELMYILNSNNRWEKMILKKFVYEINKIDFVSICEIKDNVNIFYSFQNMNDNNIKIIHLNKGRFNWKMSSFNALFNEKHKPYFVDYNKNGDLFLLFKNSELELCINCYFNKDKVWRLFKRKLQKEINSVIKNFFVDSKDNIYIIYENNNDTYVVYKNIRDLFNEKSWQEDIIIENKSYDICKVFEFEESLWILLNDKNDIYYKQLDYLKTNNEEIKIANIENVDNIKYISSTYKNIEIIKPINTLYVTKENEIYLLGMDKNVLIENTKLQEENLKLQEKELEDKQIIEELNNIVFNEEVEMDTEGNIEENNCIKEDSLRGEENKENMFKKLKNYLNI